MDRNWLFHISSILQNNLEAVDLVLETSVLNSATTCDFEDYVGPWNKE